MREIVCHPRGLELSIRGLSQWSWSILRHTFAEIGSQSGWGNPQFIEPGASTFSGYDRRPYASVAGTHDCICLDSNGSSEMFR